MAVLLSSAFCLCIESALAAPFPNLTASQTEVAPAWVDDPSGRGTWNLLYSCTFTILLCVWTSIHLNVPPPDERVGKAWLRKVKWLFIALLAPEFVVYVAFEQWMVAFDLLKKLNKLSKESSDKLSEQTRGKTKSSETLFDMTYAHFVVMGGLAVDVGHLHDKLTRATLTKKGILFLAERGQFVHPTRQSIRDKSKANLLAKGLVCLQILWVAGQAIERKVAGFPITLLEVHTLVHVTCALVMYSLWVRKPFDVTDPIIININDYQDAVVLMIPADGVVDGDLLCYRAKNSSRDQLVDFFACFGHDQSVDDIYAEDFIIMLAAIVIPAAYGGVHLSALSIMFPTPVERLLWKIACYSLLGSGAFL
ncbi:hypothetical protein GP486_007855, partial [Trichoglossum hirsutum]